MGWIVRCSFSVLFLVIPVLATSQSATVMVTIFDAAGIPAQDARLYVYDIKNKTFSDYVYTDESITLDLQPGRYRLYSSFTAQKGDYLARYASPEAKIDLKNGELQTVILTLRESDASSTQVSYSTLQKMGLEREVYPELN